MHRSNKLLSALATILAAGVIEANAAPAPSLAKWTWKSDVTGSTFAARQPDFLDMGPDADNLDDLLSIDAEKREAHIRRQTPTGMSPTLETYKLPDDAFAVDFGEVNGKPGAEIVYLSVKGTASYVTPIPSSAKSVELFRFAEPMLEKAPLLEPTHFLFDRDSDGHADILTRAGGRFQWHLQKTPGKFEAATPEEARLSRNASFRILDNSWMLGYRASGQALGDAAGFGFRAPIRTDAQFPIAAAFDETYNAPAVVLGSGSRQPDDESSMDILRAGALSAIGPSSVDVNGDGAIDICSVRQASDTLKDAKSRVELQIAASAKSGAGFKQSIDLDGLAWDPLPLADLNGDGALDLFLVKLDFDIASLNQHVKSFFGKGLEGKLSVHYYREEKKGYSRQPDLERNIRLLGDPRGLMRPFPRMVYNADFTGDKLPDLLIRENASTLTLYPFDTKTNRYAPKPAAEFALPADLTQQPSTRDLNHDGKSDLLLWVYDKDERDRARLYITVTR